MTDVFAPYGHALASLGGWALLMLVLSFVSIIGSPKVRTQSGQPARDYADPYYRRARAFQNAVEIAGPFVAATVAAILTGASPFWVNLLASVFLVSRIAMVVVHIGTQLQPLRSICWMVGYVCCAALAVLAILGAFAG